MRYICTTPLTADGTIPTLQAGDRLTPDVFNCLSTSHFPLAHKLYLIKRAESNDIEKDIETTAVIKYLVKRGHMKGRKLCNKALPVIKDAIAQLQPDELFHVETLTVKERLRLMGVSDKDIYCMTHPRQTLKVRGYTDEQINEMLVADVTDKELSKQAGNSIVVDVIYNIFRKMFIDKGPESD